ncbi:hypothetical protein SPRG_07996 [Saprolegnia parasitica CBS 223.65]|uniref:RING-type domain-containing protein n=1 Tax=Saprolegnia parasitica (strain CBS 223.65) TaxID=695850 RepID=A0A067CIG4_SAPPC|nr:hypothetical protein SPRG_07996 [Saprolegnia parasitica CBS 223.65]KDO26592.1 hypothetical protein SPRG_07996 [Saprolegnia parasitica CBS 223.65]|eukprot:XP_012202734.1 hypothetical protein SPRG_07996 [Saprolegnia parasitica CBS 223.65]
MARGKELCVAAEIVHRRADIRRATSLRDLDVHVIPLDDDDDDVFLPWTATQYEVVLEYRTSDLSWKVQCTYRDVRRYLKRVRSLAKNAKCARLQQLRAETRRIVLCAIFAEKAPVIAKLLSLVFVAMAATANQVATCDVHRDLLHATNDFCAIEYPLELRASQLMRQMSLVHGVEDDCCICLCAGDGSHVALRCGHVFHEACICVWYSTRLNCPVCRQ